MNQPNPRDLEWQRRYREHDTPWDKGAPAPPLQAFLATGKMSGRVLVPGCGRGHDVRAIARQAGCSAVGLDLSEAAIADAQRLATDDGLASTAEFVIGDFFHPPAAFRGAFDWLVEHTCFCAIDPGRRADYVRAAASALREGGTIFAIFYLMPDVESGPPFAVSREELGQLFDPHFTLLEEWLPTQSFPGREGREWVQLLRKRGP